MQGQCGWVKCSFFCFVHKNQWGKGVLPVTHLDHDVHAPKRSLQRNLVAALQELRARSEKRLHTLQNLLAYVCAVREQCFECLSALLLQEELLGCLREGY